MSNANERLQKILKCIDDIEFILENNEIKITRSIEDKRIKPAMRMNIV